VRRPLTTLLGTVLALSFRRYAASCSFSLDRLKFFNLVNSSAFSWDLPWTYFLSLGAFMVLSLVPAAIWSGAITPTIIPVNITVPYVASLVGDVGLSNNPLFNAGAQERPGFIGHCTIIQHNGTALDPSAAKASAASYGSFHFCFNSLRPALLYSAAHASTTSTRVPTKHLSVRAKLDLSGYSYLGRSYGVGMSVGISAIPSSISPLSFVFHEHGILASVACSRNFSSAFRLNCIGQSCTTITTGTLPEGRTASIGTVDFFNGNYTRSVFLPNDMMSWGSDYQSSSRTTWISIAPGYNKTDAADSYGFAEFDKTQCLISFKAAEFQVAVNVSARVITVSPAAAEVAWPSSADTVLAELSAEHNYISYNDGNSAGSQLGHALRSNLNSLRALSDSYDTTQDEDSLLRSLEDFFADLMDNSLIAYNEARLIVDNSSQVVEAIVSRHAIRFGGSTFVYAAFAINVLFVGVFVFEAWRTCWWRGICDVDLNNIASVVVAASAGGTALASYIEKKGDGQGDEGKGVVATGKTKLRVVRAQSNQLALVAADDDISE